MATLTEQIEHTFHHQKLASANDKVRSVLRRDPSIKVASMDGPPSWLDRFQGTPLFAEALKLERASLEQEAAREQVSAQRMQESQVENQSSDQVRMQKKMLELQLAEMQEATQVADQQLQAAAAPQATQEAAPVRVPPAEAVKTSSLNKDTLPRKVARGLVGGLAGGTLLALMRDPTMFGGVGGAVTGAFAGAGMAKGKYDPHTGERSSPTIKHRIIGGLAGGAAGGALGAASGYSAARAAEAAANSKSLKRLADWAYAHEKTASASEMFALLKGKLSASPTLQTLKGKLTEGVAKHPNVVDGGLIGALGGAATGALSAPSHYNQRTGEMESPTVGQRLSGGLKGGLVGGALGAGTAGIHNWANKKLKSSTAPPISMNDNKIEVKQASRRPIMSALTYRIKKIASASPTSFNIKSLGGGGIPSASSLGNLRSVKNPGLSATRASIGAKNGFSVSDHAPTTYPVPAPKPGSTATAPAKRLAVPLPAPAPMGAPNFSKTGSSRLLDAIEAVRKSSAGVSDILSSMSDAKTAAVAASFIEKIASSKSRIMAGGALAGGLLGTVGGLMSGHPQIDKETMELRGPNSKERMGNVFRGALGGTAVGGLLGLLGSSPEFVSKHPGLIGALSGGALGGAAGYATTPKKFDPDTMRFEDVSTKEKLIRSGKGALIGGLMGGAAGHFSPAVIERVKKNN